MRRRSRGMAVENMGLLLDTMCNAFGGVMFIAMLVMVLSQLSEPLTRPEPADARRKERIELQMEVARLEAAKDQQQSVRHALESAPYRSSIEKLHALKQDVVEAEENAKTTAADVAQVRQESERTAEEEKALHAENEHLKKEISELKAALTDKKGTTYSRELYLPRLRPSEDVPLWFIVKWNEIFFLRLPDDLGALNLSAVDHTDHGDSDTFVALRGKGISLQRNGWHRSSMIRVLLARRRPSDFNLQFAVYPDSYATFVPALNFFRKCGYDCNWAIMCDMNMPLNLSQGRPPVQ